MLTLTVEQPASSSDVVLRTTTQVARSVIVGGLMLASGLILIASTAHAGICGDDVAGIRVACACGDIVVSDVVLRADDPVVTTRCRLNGLVVRAPALAESITIDLAGLSLLGNSYGVGIRVESGGNDGALVIGGSGGSGSSGGTVGQIVAFGTGIQATRKNSIRRIERVQTIGCRHHGLNIRSAGVLLVEVSAIQNGGDGIRMYGQGGRMVGVLAERNAGAGIRLKSRGAVVDARAVGNGGHGIVSDGRGNDISRVVSSDNRGHGLVLRGHHQITAGSVSNGNARGAIRGRVAEDRR